MRKAPICSDFNCNPTSKQLDDGVTGTKLSTEVHLSIYAMHYVQLVEMM